MVNSAVEIIFQQLCELCKNTIVTCNDLGFCKFIPVMDFLKSLFPTFLSYVWRHFNFNEVVKVVAGIL